MTQYKSADGELKSDDALEAMAHFKQMTPNKSADGGSRRHPQLPPPINVSEIFQTTIFLGTGKTCSGPSWQPIVNTLQGMGLSFLGVFVGTWVACTYMFNFGLRIGRNFYSSRLNFVEEPLRGKIVVRTFV